MMKVCKICGIEKNINEFYPALKWYRGECKECSRAKTRAENRSIDINYNELRKCKECEREKESRYFNFHGNYFSKKCKDCINAKRRTGKPNTGVFKKGHQTWNKGIPVTEETKRKLSVALKGREAPMKGAKHSKLNCRSSRMSGAYKGWKELVKTRDGFKCTKCGAIENLHCHHIKPWKENPELRYDINNGQTLCASCHCSIEKIGHTWNRGKVRTPEMRQRMSESKKGSTAWNKGLKGQVIVSDETKKKISEKTKKNWDIRKGNFV